jgi:transposase-like protein
MRGIPFSIEIKELIINQVKDGKRIDDVAHEFNVYPNTIRKWLSQAGGASGVSSSGRNLRSNDLLISKLQRVINRELSKKKIGSGKIVERVHLIINQVVQA